MGHNWITQTEPERLQVAALPIDLIAHKGECSGGSRDLIHGHRVRAGMVMTTPSDLAQGANQSMPHEYQWARSVALEHVGVGRVGQS